MRILLLDGLRILLKNRALTCLACGRHWFPSPGRGVGWSSGTSVPDGQLFITETDTWDDQLLKRRGLFWLTVCRFQSMTDWPCCFGPVVKKQIIVELNCSPCGQEARKRPGSHWLLYDLTLETWSLPPGCLLLPRAGDSALTPECLLGMSEILTLAMTIHFQSLFSSCA